MIREFANSIPLSRLYYRFYGADRKVTPYACPLHETPHAKFAAAVIHSRPIPSCYEAYIHFATKCYEQRPEERHSPERFRANILAWQSNFNLCEHLIEVGFRHGIFFILNGAHRAAFAYARGNDSAVPYLLKPELDEEWGWPLSVEPVESIQQVFPEECWALA